MKLTPVGKLALFLVLLGAAFGGYRFLGSKTGAGAGNGSSITAPDASSGRSASAPDGGSGAAPADAPATSAVAPVGAGELMIVTSASKRGWLNDQIDKFNAQSDVKLVPRLVETREAMQQILAGKLQPALWSPSSVIWADRLAEVLQEKTGSSPLDTSDPSSYRSVLKTPIVFLTTKENAKTLRPLLSSSQCWVNIQKLSTGQIKFPGAFKWAHADPLASNSGMLTLALIIGDYASRTGQSGSVGAAANSPAFMGYLKSLESKIVYDASVAKGSSALVKSFSDDPTRYAFITAYESAAFDAVQANPDLAVIYPNPTVNAENAVAYLKWPSLSDEQKKAAQAFMTFIATPAAAQDGLKEHFRPLRGGSADAGIAALSANGFQTSYSAIEVPPYTALNNVAYKWRTEIARQ